MRLEPLDAQSAPVAVGGYCQAMRVRGAAELVCVSGQVPEVQDGAVPDDFAAQCRLVWAHVIAQLACAGMSVAHLVKVTTFLSDRMYADENGATATVSFA